MCEGSEAPGGLTLPTDQKMACVTSSQNRGPSVVLDGVLIICGSMKAELALGHAEPTYAHGREISMRYVALTIGTCVMAIAVRVHRRSKRWTNIEESRTPILAIKEAMVRSCE